VAQDVLPLQLERVSKEYRHDGRPLHALDDVSLSIAPGEFVAVIGKSGSGKSTLLNLMGLMDAPTRGVVRHQGRDLTSASEARRGEERLRGLGFVFQHFYLVPTLRAEQNVALPMKAAGVDAAAREARMRELFEAVGLTHRRAHFPHELSGGEQQMVAVARALANRPYLLLADEPTGELDPESSARIVALLEHVNRESGTAVVMVTHDLDVIPRGVKRVVLSRGSRLPEESA
jgi:putative ABC transport system ATP-binding protein